MGRRLKSQSDEQSDTKITEATETIFNFSNHSNKLI